ncbi:hypothetical protein D9756_009527 [Leucocoprinus leucothites]|uniref:FHA domain-containing protein n=1 Tax=Leucocoprinus leucothites TaxID=201217 RepID=A0A8H5CWI6_9AGAR|nr:hypothetical protein D9756_009527 [Leucoagaricus leucothites]
MPPPPPPYTGQPQQPAQAPTLFPALYLYPLNDSFVPKHISLVAGQRVKIGRQTNPKTAPGEKNGFFDSKVLSRQHAEIWEDGNKIYIKDVKSSNGTFINGERLSPEGVESEPYELKSDDIVEFGIDIVGEDNKTIIHHKVAARAVCVFSDQDAQIAARAEQHQQQQQQQQHLLAQQHAHHPHHPQQYAQQSLMGNGQPGPNGSQFSFQRRPNVGAAQGALGGIGGMGGSMRPPGKSGLTFEHILSRLQGELQKSRETGSELHSLNGSMSEIHDVLGGNMPSNVPPYPASLPPVRPTRQSSPSSQNQQPQEPSHSPSSSSSSPNLISQLQSQLHETQSSLAEHATRKEVHDLRQLFGNRRQEIMFDESDHHESRRSEDDEEGLLEPRGGFDPDDDDDIQHIRMLDEVDHVDDDDEEDDRRSIATIIPHELERVEEEDEEEVAAAEREHLHDQVDESGDYADGADDRADPIDPEREREDRSSDESERERQLEREAMRKQEDLNVGRPRTPEPLFGLRTNGDSPSSKDTTKPPSINTSSSSSPRTRSGTLLAPTNSKTSPLALQPTNGVTNDQMFEQVLQLSAQMSAMVQLTSSMEIGELERAVKETRETHEREAEALKEEKAEEQEGIKTSLTSFFTEWKKTVDGQWSDVREEWREERERLRRAREEWETRVTHLDTSLDKMNQLSSTTTSLVKDFGTQKQEMVRMQNQLREVQLAGLRAGAIANGDVIAHGHGRGSGLVTPPSPRSQSSDSGGGGRSGRRRRKRRSVSAGAGASPSINGRGRVGVRGAEGEESESESEVDGVVDAVKVTEGASSSVDKTQNDDGTTTTTTLLTRAYHISHDLLVDAQPKEISTRYSHFDPTSTAYEDDAGSTSSSYSQFASEEEVEEGKKVPGPVKHKSASSSATITAGKHSKSEHVPTHLPTPQSLTASVVSESEESSIVRTDDAKRPVLVSVLDCVEGEDADEYVKNAVNFQTAGAVVVLAVAAAAVFWKVRSE